MKPNIKSKKNDFVVERCLMDGTNPTLEEEHRARYEFAKQYTKGKRVTDAACGMGYGADILEASEYNGIDIDKDAIEHAKSTYNGSFKVADIQSCNMKKVDVIVSFETIEHIDDPLKFIERASKHCDTFIFSVPNNETPGDNPFHKWIFNENELKPLVEPFFDSCEWFHQERGRIEKHCYPGYIIGVCKHLS